MASLRRYSTFQTLTSCLYDYLPLSSVKIVLALIIATAVHVMAPYLGRAGLSHGEPHLATCLGARDLSGTVARASWFALGLPLFGLFSSPSLAPVFPQEQGTLPRAFLHHHLTLNSSLIEQTWIVVCVCGWGQRGDVPNFLA